MKYNYFQRCLDLEDEMLAAAAAQTSNRSSIGLDFDTIHRYDVVSIVEGL